MNEILNKWKKSKKWEQIKIKDLEDKKYFTSIKIDGELTLLYYNNGNVYYISRYGKKRKGFIFDEEIKKVLKKYRKFIGVGELYVIDEKGKDIPYPQALKVLRNINKDNLNKIRFKLIDVLYIDNKKINLNYKERIDIINKIFKNTKYIKPIKVLLLTKKQIEKAYKKYVIEKGHEGLVVVDLDLDKFYKIKRFINIDAFVLYVEKSKKHPNLMGALGLALVDNDKYYFIGNVGTGFTKSQRKKWLNFALKNKEKIEGNIIFIKPKIVVEINAKELNEGENIIYDKNFNIIGKSNFGSLREPKFVRLRSDKNVNEKDVGLNQIKSFIKKSFYNNQNSLSKFSFLKKESGFDLNSIQIRIDGNLKENIISFVKRNFLQKYLFYNTDLNIFGRVLNPHITLFYTKNDFEKIIEILERNNIKEIEFELGEIKKFGLDKDVFYIEVKSQQLIDIFNILNNELKEPQKFKFIAHISLAYVQKGTHDFLLGDKTFYGIKYKTSLIEFSSFDPKIGTEYYNLKNKDRGKVLDLMYRNDNINLESLKGKNIAFDFDYTLTLIPNKAKQISDYVKSTGGKVYIITGRGPSLINDIKLFLEKNNIYVDEIIHIEKDYSDSDFIKNPELVKEIVNFKLNKIKEKNINVVFEDDNKVIFKLPSNIQKYYIPTPKNKQKYYRFIYPQEREMFSDIISKLVYVANKYGYKIYAAGGYVRDLIIGKNPKDLDVVVVKEDEGINAPLEFAKKFKQEFSN